MRILGLTRCDPWKSRKALLPNGKEGEKGNMPWVRLRATKCTKGKEFRRVKVENANACVWCQQTTTFGCVYSKRHKNTQLKASSIAF